MQFHIQLNSYQAVAHHESIDLIGDVTEMTMFEESLPYLLPSNGMKGSALRLFIIVNHAEGQIHPVPDTQNHVPKVEVV